MVWRAFTNRYEPTAESGKSRVRISCGKLLVHDRGEHLLTVPYPGQGGRSRFFDNLAVSHPIRALRAFTDRSKPRAGRAESVLPQVYGKLNAPSFVNIY
jgi:hypothetical protein